MTQPAQSYYEERGHYGLVLTEKTKLFADANPYTLDLPAVDIKTLPESQGVMRWLQIENQLQQGSCQGQARTSAQEVAYYRQTAGEVIQLCRQWAYVKTQEIDGIRGDNGSTIEGGAESAEKDGTCLESFAPYTGNYFTRFSEAAVADAKTRLMVTHQSLPNYDAVLRWLVHGIGGIVIGIRWNRSCEPNGRNAIESYNSNLPSGGHALALVDWTKSLNDTAGRPYIVMANSWGKTWGDNGVAYISPTVIEQWCSTQTVIGYSEMVGDGIKPRAFDWAQHSLWS